MNESIRIPAPWTGKGEYAPLGPRFLPFLYVFKKIPPKVSMRVPHPYNFHCPLCLFFIQVELTSYEALSSGMCHWGRSANLDQMQDYW